MVVVDDDPLARHVYRSLLDGMAPAMEHAGAAASAREAMELVLTRLPDVVLVDLLLGDESGLDLVRALIQQGFAGSILAVSVLPEDPYASRALEAGASGYLRKEDVGRRLPEAIATVVQGKTYLDPQTAAHLLRQLLRARGPRPQRPALTPREHETLELLARGLSNKEISASLRCTTRTAKAHVSRVLQKLGVEDRTQAAVLAIRFGLVDRGAS
ncbi:LuxR family transcriptional regulator [Limnochorda pilosa]|uniref:LuxR family transcriptional regulator n=1 Tax=Limnochorda pilosa TaxID=1555112 RepID=A0A0K2SNK1_LIMPI|nr:LuxR family transcriptional regulator [Limnochorda pilosa]